MPQSADPFVRRVHHELKLRELTVARIERLGDFTSLSFDDHVKFMFQDADGEQVRRDYTPRRYSREALGLVIEFALHGDGKASDWARNAVVGQQALVGGPRGSMIVPLELDWHVLAGGSRAIVLVQAEAADRRAFAGAAAKRH